MSEHAENPLEIGVQAVSRTVLNRMRSASPLDTSGASPALFAAMVKAQSEVTTVGKDGENKHGGYNYATAEAMIREGRRRLTNNGMGLMVSCYQADPSRPSGDIGKRFLYSEVVMIWKIIHCEGSLIEGWSELPAISSGATPPDKAVKAAATYLLGYVLRDLLMIDRAEEEAYSPDQRREEEERERREQPKQRQDANVALARQTLAKQIGCSSPADVDLILNWLGLPADVTCASLKVNPTHAAQVMNALSAIQSAIPYGEMLDTARNAVEPPPVPTEEPPITDPPPEPENAETDYCAVVVDLLRREIGCKRSEQVDHVLTWLCLPEDVTAVTIKNDQDHAKQVWDVLTSDTQSPYSEILAEAERSHQASEAVEEAFT